MASTALDAHQDANAQDVQDTPLSDTNAPAHDKYDDGCPLPEYEEYQPAGHLEHQSAELAFNPQPATANPSSSQSAMPLLDTNASALPLNPQPAGQSMPQPAGHLEHQPADGIEDVFAPDPRYDAQVNESKRLNTLLSEANGEFEYRDNGSGFVYKTDGNGVWTSDSKDRLRRTVDAMLVPCYQKYAEAKGRELAVVMDAYGFIKAASDSGKRKHYIDIKGDFQQIKWPSTELCNLYQHTLLLAKAYKVDGEKDPCVTQMDRSGYGQWLG